METTASFGYWVRRQRKALDLTQQALAGRVGCSAATLKKIEADERRPARQMAGRLPDLVAATILQPLDLPLSGAIDPEAHPHR